MRALLLLVVCLATVWCKTSQSPKIPGCIPGCKCTSTSPFDVKITRCANNITLTRNIFANLNMKKVNVIEFKGAVIDKIERTAFSGLKDLRTLSFKNTGFGDIDLNGVSLEGLTILSFRGCSFRNGIPPFDSDTLEELIFNNCNLSNVPAFGDLPSLEHLDLSNNFIKDISNDTFSDLESLTTLNLSKNNITMLPSSAFFDNTQLSTLYLDSNPLKMFSLNSELILEVLSLSSCELSTFDSKTTKNLVYLNSLNLSNNKLASFHKETLNGLLDLEYINLSNNRLKHLDADVFTSNTKLRSIILDRNNFKTLPVFQSVNGTTFATVVFQCQECQLDYLADDTFKNMPSIQTLDLSRNNLPNINNYLQHIPGLVKLNLEGNYISKISPTAFIYNPNLKTLKLTGNPLIKMNPSLFKNNNLLNTLDLSETDLSKIWEDDKTVLNSLERLMLSSSNIKNIRPSDLERMPNLKVIDIEDNPLNCSSEFRAVLMSLVEKNVTRVKSIKDKDEMHDTMGGDIVGTWTDLARQVCPKDYGLISFIESEEGGLDDDDQYPFFDYNDSTVDDFDNENDIFNPLDNLRKKKITIDPPSGTNRYEKKELDQYNNEILDYIQEGGVDSRYGIFRSTSYVLLITVVFILTALLVIVLTVCITLFFLKKNRNIDRANLPRFRIPVWSSAPSIKKHSGSVYKTLTEEYPTRYEYEFKSTPAVHSPSHA